MRGLTPNAAFLNGSSHPFNLLELRAIPGMVIESHMASTAGSSTDAAVSSIALISMGGHPRHPVQMALRRSREVIHPDQRLCEAEGYSLRHIPPDRDGLSLCPRLPSSPRGRRKTPDRERSRQRVPHRLAIERVPPTSAWLLFATTMRPYSCPPPGSIIDREMTGTPSLTYTGSSSSGGDAEPVKNR